MSQSVSSISSFSFTDLYKYTGKTVSLSQHERRMHFLSQQKDKRYKVADEHRQLSDLNDQNEQDETPTASKKRNLKFKLMLSEWLTDVPEDLQDIWLVKFAPEGFRILLVAKKGSTICYTDRGRFYFRLRTNFPGGNKDSPVNTTVLDCIYNSGTDTFFILDCLYWNSMSMLDSEANFRFFWLKSKFNELPELAKCLKYKFVLLDFFPAERPLIQDILFNQLEVEGHNYSYDGVVFYHKESHYTFGYTPLVGWLASYMIPEKLQIDVPVENMAKKPKNYVSMEIYLEEIKKRKKKIKKKENDVSMDIL